MIKALKSFFGWVAVVAAIAFMIAMANAGATLPWMR